MCMHVFVLLVISLTIIQLIQIDVYTPMFIAALFTISKTWKQPKCLSTEN